MRQSTSIASLALVLAVASVATAQMTYRLKGVVTDDAGKPVAGASLRAEALIGFRGEQFVGQKEFETTTNAKGQWTILGLTSGIWAFEATGPDLIPQVVVLPINFTNRKPQSATGGSFSWDLPMRVRRSSHAGMTAAANAATARQTDQALSSIGGLAGGKDPDTLCAAGEMALLVRQHTLAAAIFNEVVKAQPTYGCAPLGLASAALMRNDWNTASKMFWVAIDLAPREQRPALGAAIKDLQAVTGIK